MSLIGSNNEQKIWNYLYAKLGNAYGVAGLMGNLYAESALKPNNLQNSYEKKLGYTDDNYTSAVDNGTYTNFVRDSAGFGLAQWTFWSRKQNLLDYCKSRGTSIGDLEMQLDFLYKELSESYVSVLTVLKNASSVSQASNAVLLQFERPADQSVAVQNKRTSYGQNYFNKYAKTINTGGTIMSVKIGHASIDENNKISGGAAGDQTGKEVCVRDWYNKSWNCVIRPKDKEVAEKIAKAMEQACASNYIGYDQSQRTTLYTQAKACGWDLSKIKVPCEADCSSLVSVCVNAAGISVSKDIYTGNEKAALVNTGKFIVLTESKYIASSTYLKRGDILLSSGHTAVVLSDGAGVVSSDSGYESSDTTTTVTDFPQVPFTVKVIISDLNYRSSGSMSGKVLGQTGKGTFTIVEVNSDGWGRLKSGAGWIYLGNPTYCTIQSSVASTAPSTPSTFKSYRVKVTADVLNIRKGAGTNYGTNGAIRDKGVYTIVAESNGQGATKWGKLKSGAGWVSLDYCKKI